MDTRRQSTRNTDADLTQKIILVHRDNKNKYGFSLAGHNPVVIKAVRKGCPADIAGVKAGDIIVKVEGKLVIEASHEAVTELIKGLQKVTLTLAERHDITIDCFSLLKPNPEVTATFLRYLISTETPNHLLFLIMTEAYAQKAGKPKDKRRWIYEIATAFLVHTAPLDISMGPQITYNVVNVIQDESIKDDQTLSNVFLAARESVRSEVLKQFTEFKKTKHNLGSGTKTEAAEIEAAEGILTPQLNRLMESIESPLQISQSTLDIQSVIASSIATILRFLNYEPASNTSVLGRCPAFLQKDRSAMGPQEDCFLKGHKFRPVAFTTTKYCGQCNRVIWGIGKNAYQCQVCDFNVHISACAKSLLHSCQGRKKKPTTKRTSWWSFSGGADKSKSDSRKNFEQRRRDELNIAKIANKKLQSRNLNADTTDSMTDDEARIRKITADRRSRFSLVDSKVNELMVSDDSDDGEDDPEMNIPAKVPDWENVVGQEVANEIINNDLETKRQKVILELIHTEKLHLKSLKILRKYFYKPIVRNRIFEVNFIRELFPNLTDLIDIHRDIIKAMEKRQAESGIIEFIGDIIVDKFSGDPGYALKEAYIICYSNQSLTLAMLKEKVEADPKIDKFIKDYENKPLCKHTTLVNLISSGCLRLMRYTLLLDQIAKYTQVDHPDFQYAVKAIECTKDVSAFVNSGIREAENYQTLVSIQSNLDRSSFDLSNNPFVMEYKAFDLMQHRLLHFEDVTCKSSETGDITLKALLLEGYFVLLEVKDDKYYLRCDNWAEIEPHSTKNKQKANIQIPIMRLADINAHASKTDKRTIVVVNNVASPQLAYSLETESRNAKEEWLKRIQEARK